MENLQSWFLGCNHWGDGCGKSAADLLQRVLQELLQGGAKKMGGFI
jgi:hypothetical protein